MVARKVQDVWMTSISDSGNVFDIHPKYKKNIGKRLYGLDDMKHELSVYYDIRHGHRLAILLPR